MKNEIVKHDPNDTPIDALWIWVKDKQPDDWDAGTHAGDFHDIPSGSHSVKKDATDMYWDREWNNRHEASGFITNILLVLGVFMWLYVAVMFGVTRFEWTGAYFIFALKTLGIGALGTWVFFSGAGRMAG